MSNLDKGYDPVEDLLVLRVGLEAALSEQFDSQGIYLSICPSLRLEQAADRAIVEIERWNRRADIREDCASRQEEEDIARLE